MNSGQLTINGITDADLIMILKEKEKNKALGFTPQQLQPIQVQKSGQPAVQGYNNCILAWNDDIALKTVYIILHKLLHGHDKDPALP